MFRVWHNLSSKFQGYQTIAELTFSQLADILSFIPQLSLSFTFRFDLNDDNDDEGEKFHDVFEYEDKKVNNIACEVCQYRTTTMSQLRKHMVLFHQDQVSLDAASSFFAIHCTQPNETQYNNSENICTVLVRIIMIIL